jgi:hypothetical protein
MVDGYPPLPEGKLVYFPLNPPPADMMQSAAEKDGVDEE